MLTVFAWPVAHASWHGTVFPRHQPILLRKQVTRLAPLQAAVGPLEGQLAFDGAAAIKSAIGATKDAIDISSPAVQSLLEQASAAITTATPEVEALVQKSVQEAAPILQKSVEAAAPVIKNGLSAAGAGVGEVARETSELLRSNLAADQQEAYDVAARTSAQVGEVMGATAVVGAQIAGKAVGVAAPILQEGARKAVPIGAEVANKVGSTLQRGVADGIREVQPALDDLARDGRLDPSTLELIKNDAAASLSGSAKELSAGLARSLRGAAYLLSDDPAINAVVPLPPKGPLGLPSTKEVADTFSLSLTRAAAPYAVGGASLLAVLAALRELVRPLEELTRKLLAALLLLFVLKALVENWDAVYSTYEIFSGGKSLEFNPF